MNRVPTFPSNASTDTAIPLACLRLQALRLLQIESTHHKADQVLALHAELCALDGQAVWPEPGDVPGRPDHPVLVHPSQLKTRAVGTLEGRAGLIHALTHIEANAINLALDMLWRFADMPTDFYHDWWRVAQEEALHFKMLNAHLTSLGFAYGDFPAHDGLWDMAERTKDDVMARLALVPRTLEARGLDATPAVRNRLVSVGDQEGARILDIVLRDEIGHVAIGNRWYRYVCRQRRLDPVEEYKNLILRYCAPVLKGPFNIEARRKAGFTDAELALLETTR
jgi:uncharacterized ferritin-like protein (DUF455 family)